MKQAALYIRVSTPQQEKEGYSVEAQTEKLKAYATAKDYYIHKIYTDSAQSGAKLERPALQQMIEDIEEGKIDVVIVYKLDRLSRSQKNTMYLIEDVFLKNSVDFISMQESFDTTTSFGRAMIGILSVFAQLERDNITERMSMGKLERVKKGLYMGGGNVPFGYMYNEQTNELEVIEDQAAVIRRMFTLFLSGSSISSIVSTLKKEFPEYNKTFFDSSIRNRLSSVYYIGKQKYAGKVYDAIHTPIISQENFEKAQTLILHRPHANAFKRSYLLSGLIYCGHCGNRYSAYESTSKHKNVIYKNKYYRCNSRTWRYRQENAHSCDNPSFKCKELEDEVISKTIDFAASYEKKIESNKIDVTPLKRKITNLQIKKSKLLDLYLADKLEVDLFDEKNEELSKKITIIENQVSDLGMKKDREDMLQHVRKIKSVDFKAANADEIKDMLCTVISRIELDGRDATVYFYE